MIRPILRGVLVAGALFALLILLTYAFAGDFTAIEARYAAALERRDHGEVVEAWNDLNQLIDDVTLLRETHPQEAHRHLAIIHRTLGSMLTYFSTSWIARCDDPAVIHPGDTEGRAGCLQWARCGRQADALGHFVTAQEECVLAGLRVSQYPCSQAHGLAQRARSKLRSCTRRMAR